MSTEDGQAFVKNLAYFVRTHEKALANALQLSKQSSKHSPKHGVPSSGAGNLTTFGFASQSVKPAKMTLTPHHLYYLLSRFEELNISVGPMNVRLENIHAEVGPTNYVSFLSGAHGSKGKSSDRDSIRSISSMRSVMSGMSALWTNLGLSSISTAKLEKQKLALQEDLKYLYSAFTKIPCLRICPDNKARLITGYEEFPFDTAVPLYAFKNISSLEICDIDFRQIFGWDRLAEQIRSLSIKRGSVDDPADVLTNIVLDDMDRRRRRSAKSPSSAAQPWPAASPALKTPDSTSSSFAPESPFTSDKRPSVGSPRGMHLVRSGSTGSRTARPTTRQRQKSHSPHRPPSSRHGSANGQFGGSSKIRRESGSSGSSRASTPRTSSTNLLLNVLPATKWRFLRHLGLADNGLTTLSVLSLWPVCNTLQSFDLSSNHFGEIPDSLASLPSLTALNLSNCMIDSLHSLTRSSLPAITTLNLRANRLASIAGIEGLLALERLDLRENKIADPDELARVTALPNIREIYVAKNPFTKTHSNYRVTIFNLFRKMPGNTEDVLIDATGPTHSERKQLIDRAPEPASVPVVKLQSEDDPSSKYSPAKQDNADAEDAAVPESSSNREAGSPTGTNGANTQRRRKAPKRRIVELSSSENWQRSRSESFYDPTGARDGHDLDNQTEYSTSNSTTAEPNPATNAPKLQPFDGTGSSANGKPGMNGAAEFQREELSNSTLTGEAYRKKIEALRNDFGATWLSALDNSEWPSQRPSGQFPEKDFSSATLRPRPQGTAMSQGIISGTGT
ncbi:MAG: hypothetical protein M1821_004798 [Bathelium mastoideum]|nr:MAG: hypothetical protein M1821_004798 [Bathelium mastoideum]